ncbi:hypothetical protein UA38_11695 [Photobacterium kishitanii]|uniref:DUF3487 family protein n=1 Tax=Photobacterium kishitanii TaxID=318456 RepID=UPI0005D3A3AB|nr:DUF3487 family protein [Photobacterium kishitanii]KJG57032.1 hypothetical protein UA38_11695 [Photobacterium kishitanii]KJG60556.1 hypothetical protein UA42_14480 [Photobacterium kishitanii]KJG64858.1 hypothetical protein UA40_14175 [Photobacterium kishitanii]KJG68494.1 hypothetical protein UA41_16585 [Photobacterium kishitanii]OBU31222.1 hypothetical protein AYY23_20125 [Photobacterium kishitanii]
MAKRQETEYKWSSLSALNNQPTVAYGLTLNELSACSIIGSISALFLGILAGLIIDNFKVGFGVFGFCCFLLTYIAIRQVNKIKLKYSSNMYAIRIRKWLLINGFGSWN